METFIREFLRPLFKPAVWLASFALRKNTAGNFKTQGALLMVEVALFVAAILRVVATLSVR